MSSSNLRLRCTIHKGSRLQSRRNAGFTPDTNTSSHTTTRAGEPCNRRVQTPRAHRPAEYLRTRTDPKPRSFRQTTSERLDGDRRRLRRHRGLPQMPPSPRPSALGLSPIKYMPYASVALHKFCHPRINRGASRRLHRADSEQQPLGNLHQSSGTSRADSEQQLLGNLHQSGVVLTRRPTVYRDHERLCCAQQTSGVEFPSTLRPRDLTLDRCAARWLQPRPPVRPHRVI